MYSLASAEWRSDTHPADRINALEAEVERLKKTEQFLRSERPMARRLTELEEIIAIKTSNFMENHAKHLISLKRVGELEARVKELEDVLNFLVAVKSSEPFTHVHSDYITAGRKVLAKKEKP